MVYGNNVILRVIISIIFHLICRSFDFIRSPLLRNNQKRTTVQFGPPHVGHHGFGHIRLPYGQHGPSSLRDVLNIRERFVSHSPGPRSSVWQGVSRRAEHIGSGHTVLSHTKIHSGNFAQV